MAFSKIIFNGETLMDVTKDTITASSALDGITAHNAAGNKITGSLGTVAQAIPSISVSSSGLITATSVQAAGVVESGTQSTTQQLTTQAAKTVTPTESVQNAVAANVYTTGIVKVGAISTTYVGSGIAQNDSTDLTVSGATVTAPAGYYAQAASKSITSGSAATPATTVTANPTISVSSSGLITATASATKNVTPTVSAGYVSSGTAGTITVNGSNTQQLTTVGATTYNTSTTDQTIPAGRYTTGTQTIKAVTVSGLSAANIANGVTVKVGDANDDDRIASVTGTLTFVNYYTGSSTPSSSTGSNGDIYLKTVG